MLAGQPQNGHKPGPGVGCPEKRKRPLAIGMPGTRQGVEPNGRRDPQLQRLRR
jgi:hypothetical protein